MATTKATFSVDTSLRDALEKDSTWNIARDAAKKFFDAVVDRVNNFPDPQELAPAKMIFADIASRLPTVQLEKSYVGTASLAVCYDELALILEVGVQGAGKTTKAFEVLFNQAGNITATATF